MSQVRGSSTIDGHSRKKNRSTSSSTKQNFVADEDVSLLDISNQLEKLPPPDAYSEHNRTNKQTPFSIMYDFCPTLESLVIFGEDTNPNTQTKKQDNEYPHLSDLASKIKTLPYELPPKKQ
ncbi:dnaE [Acrasis kona]|uniref:DnaE n=1 Tax=Acrasis kona TaxID=1008807 RepID=A0AAW2YI46_9EUKA